MLIYRGFYWISIYLNNKSDSMKHRYYLVDVFTNDPFNGAQITVFPKADNLSRHQMISLANELTFGEVVFVSPPVNIKNTCKLTIYKKSSIHGFGSHTMVAAGHVLGAIGFVNLNGESVLLKCESQC